jgi:hypothetical protein
MNVGNNLVQAMAQAIHLSADPLPIMAGEWRSSGAAPQVIAGTFSPPKMRSSLQSTSFAPVVLNPMPTIDDAVDVDPDFFEGANQAGSGPGSHFTMVLFIKNNDKIQDQLLKALSATVTILAQNIPRVLVHCIQKDARLPPLSTATSNNFPTAGMKAWNYMFVPNPWLLQPGTSNKLQLPAAKVGKDGRQLYNENRGYNGPNQINSVLRITADINVKEAIDNLQMEVKDKHLQIQWNLAQKKNTKNQIVIYGIPPGFDPKGIMHELLYALKESKKEL